MSLTQMEVNMIVALFSGVGFMAAALISNIHGERVRHLGIAAIICAGGASGFTVIQVVQAHVVRSTDVHAILLSIIIIVMMWIIANENDFRLDEERLTLRGIWQRLKNVARSMHACA
jgi:hypothetical protein